MATMRSGVALRSCGGDRVVSGDQLKFASSVAVDVNLVREDPFVIPKRTDGHMRDTWRA